MTTPRDNPGIHDTITINGLPSPGKSVIQSGGDRDMQVDIQGQPGYAGKVALYRAEELSTIVYRFEMWRHAHFAQWDQVYKVLRSAMKKRPKPDTVEVIDPRIDVGPRFTVKTISKLITIGPGLWGRDITLIEWQKLRQIPREPANQAVQDAFKAELAGAQAERNAAQREAAVAVDGLKASATPVVAAISSGLGLAP